MRVIRRIDRGGFGYVNEVELPDGSRVAQKCFDPRNTDSAERAKLLRRFEREVRIQTVIKHPNIMPILGSGLSDDPPWFTMPLASLSLQEKIRQDLLTNTVDPRPWPDILSAVEELHRLGYVHRDLKPENILYVNNVWVVSDFGLILPTMRDTTVLTSSGSAYGSHYYAAPEQTTDFRNAPDQVDIYSIGCMLHDAIGSASRRIPFAQIRESGPYGPLLEKCTEVDYTRRYPTVAALRASLFDLWSAASVSQTAEADNDVLAQLLSSPDSPDTWRRFILSAETLERSLRDNLLRSINSDLLLKLQILDEVLFSRMVALVCDWASGSSFEWTYCDVVGDRLLDAYRVANVRIKCAIILAALQLAVSHNRWNVMKQVGVMLGTAADNGLVDRILIEVGLDSTLESKLRRIEAVISWRRSHWHGEIARFLTSRDGT